MTVIAWDGKTLAADKQSTSAGHASTVTKIHRIPQGIVGLAGDESHIAAVLAWLIAGGDRSAYPAPATSSENDSAYALLITNDGEVRRVSGAQYCRYENSFAAIGCGRDYALAAMYLGKTAREAVEVACALDVFCGQGIDTLTLDAQ